VPYSAAAAALSIVAAVPFFTFPPIDVGLPIQPFGTIVFAGVAIGAVVLRAYGLRHGLDERDLGNLTLWIIVTGFVGAHLLDVVLYDRAEWAHDPLLPLKLWAGISSYGGFLGGAIGYALFVRAKRLPAGVVADTVVLGLLVAFSIGRIGCTLIHDHVGHATSFWLGTDYPRDELAKRHLLSAFPGAGEVVRAHNLGMYELLYLIPVNALVLWLAFRRPHALLPGGIAALTALLYAPVRFFLEFLRLELTDPKNFGLTFAQWGSIAAFAVAAFVLFRTREPLRTRPEEPPGLARGPAGKRRPHDRRRSKH
jgi:phosphatidylglycerol:prolipoprotein diacylglycerol transferase